MCYGMQGQGAAVCCPLLDAGPLCNSLLLLADGTDRNRNRKDWALERRRHTASAFRFQKRNGRYEAETAKRSLVKAMLYEVPSV